MRNIKKTDKKTTLSRETLRRLDNARLQGVMGGDREPAPTWAECTTGCLPVEVIGL